MLALRADVFDEIITGTSTTWYSSSAHNATLGRPDFLLFIAVATRVSGVSPGLSVWIDTSPDNRSWSLSTTAGGDIAIAAPSLTEGAMAQAWSWTGGGPFVRLRIVLAGTDPQCRLKVAVTGRTAD
jgi:hypothetical protein